MIRTITFIASLALASAARGDYLIKEQLETSGQTQQITLKIKDAKVRADLGEQNSAIIDSNTAETTLLLHAQKAFLKINPEQLKSQAEALERSPRNQGGEFPRHRAETDRQKRNHQRL